MIPLNYNYKNIHFCIKKKGMSSQSAMCKKL